MKRVEFVWFEAAVEWDGAPSIHIGKCDGAYDAEKSIKEFQATFPEAGDGTIMQMTVTPEGRVCYECDVKDVPRTANK